MSVVNVPQVAGVAEKDNIIYESFRRLIDQANAAFGTTNGNVTSLTGSLSAVPAGYVMYGSGTVLVGGSPDLFWDNVNSRLGVGTTTPSSPLTVAGVIESTVGGFKFPDGTTQTTAGTTGSGAATRVTFWSGAGTLSSNANFFWDDTNVRLGIGTGAPTSPLTVAGIIESTSGGIKFPDASIQTKAVVIPATAGVLWTDGGGGTFVNANFAWIDASQRLAVGSSSASYKLHVTGTGGNNVDVRSNGQFMSGDVSLLGAFIAGDGSNVSQAAFGQDTSTTAGLWGNGGGWVLRYKIADGAMGIGGAPLAVGTARLGVYGNIQAVGTGASVVVDLAGSYYVAGAQVVTTRQGGVSAALASRTAGATYGGTEQTMLQEAHDAIRTLMVALRTHGLIA